MSSSQTGNKMVVILGPTASGKSDLAVKIAKRFNGEIISADSRQVYKGLDIGSGKITKKEMAGVPHHLLNVASPKNIFSASQYQKLGEKAIKDILKRGKPSNRTSAVASRQNKKSSRSSLLGKLPIVCGGTGFYIDALISGIKLPEAPPQKELRKKLEKEPVEALFDKLKKLDPRRAETIDRFNKRRLIRALEIVLTTKKPVPTGTMMHHSTQPYDVLKIGIKKEPGELKKLIHKRLLKRLKQGMIEEVKNLHKNGLSWKRLDDLGLEYRYISRYLRGLISKKEMSDLIEKESWRYAKRQMTWFKRDKKIIWVSKEKEAENPVRRFLNK